MFRKLIVKVIVTGPAVNIYVSQTKGKAANLFSVYEHEHKH